MWGGSVYGLVSMIFFPFPTLFFLFFFVHHQKMFRGGNVVSVCVHASTLSIHRHAVINSHTCQSFSSL